uniref:Ig-like domain-containing protein n=1 Tax=Fundulus heteroclitus TaxID=8078 RepID=A0A3Q2PDN9_FUNHE
MTGFRLCTASEKVFLMHVFPVADTEVICVLSESCMLPCWLSYGSDPLIHWFYVSDGESVVHSYYKDQDQLQHQVENFKNRTSLFQDQISRGNASLLLRRVKVQDEGKYKCYSSTTGGFEQSFVNLKAEGRIALLDRFYFLLVFSGGIYPKPELTWSTEPPSNTALNITSSIQQTEEKLYSISSSLMVSDDDPYLTYSCTVSTQRSRKTVTISKEGDTGGEQLLYVSIVFFFVVVFFALRGAAARKGEPHKG